MSVELSDVLNIVGSATLWSFYIFLNITYLSTCNFSLLKCENKCKLMSKNMRIINSKWLEE